MTHAALHNPDFVFFQAFSMCVHVYVCLFVCLSMLQRAPGQQRLTFDEASSRLPSCGSWRLNGVLRPGGKHLLPAEPSHWASLVLFTESFAPTMGHF